MRDARSAIQAMAGRADKFSVSGGKKAPSMGLGLARRRAFNHPLA